jgi:hypothetical protein
MHAANKTALYGPAWILLTAIPFFFGFNVFIPTLLLFKLFVGFFYFLSIILLWRMTKNYFLVALFAFHPLVIVETFVSAHNDIVMMFFALMSFYLLQRKRLFSAIFLLVLSIFMKFATLFLIPVFVYCLIKVLQKKQIDWTHIFRLAFFSMLAIFLLSFLREEIYPWYALWFLIFLPLIKPSKALTSVVIVFTVSLLLRYLPFMILGTHFGSTPLIKWFITFAPVSLVLIYYLFIRRWLKI